MNVINDSDIRGVRPEQTSGVGFCRQTAATARSEVFFTEIGCDRRGEFLNPEDVCDFKSNMVTAVEII